MVEKIILLKDCFENVNIMTFTLYFVVVLCYCCD